MAVLFRYAAFVSYSSKDARFTKHLHRALESYLIPKSLGEFDLIGGGKKNRLYPIFRDREELSAGHLGERIEGALKVSATLIVVCSPNSAASPWVQKEIEFFVSLGRRDKIYAIIADDAPLTDAAGADCTRACFPPAFQGDALADDALEPLAADARKGKDGFRNAWLKVVAGAVGVSPGQLIDRDKKRRRLQRRAVGAGVAALAASLAIAGAWIDASAWRTRLSAHAVSLASEGRPLDAAPFAVAGLSGRADALRVRSQEADDAASGIGLHIPIRSNFDIGPMSEISLSGDGRFLGTTDRRGNVFLYDLSEEGGEPKWLGEQFFSLSFSGDSRFLLLGGLSGDEAFLYDPADPTPAPMPLGPLIAFDFSPDGRFLLTIDNRFYGRLHDLNDATREPATLGFLVPLPHSGFSGDGRFLLTLDRRASGFLHNLAASAAPRPLGELYPFHFAFSRDGRHLLLLDQNRRGFVHNLDDLSAEPIALGRIREADPTYGFSADGRFLVICGPIDDCGLHNLAEREAPIVPLGSLTAWSFSADGQFLATRTQDIEGFLLALGSPNEAPIPLGELGARSPFGFSRDSRFLLTMELRNQVRTEAVLHNVVGAAAEPFHLGEIADYFFGERFLLTRDVNGVAFLRDLDDLESELLNLGPVADRGGFQFSVDGRLVATRDAAGDGAVRDLHAPFAQGSGARLRAEICAGSGNALRPFPREVRSSNQGPQRVREALEGRPWNPCDWRGLLAIWRDPERGDGWFEGLRQWLRLMHVRHFGGGDDWLCQETTSRASERTRAARASMCARFAASEVAEETNE